MTTETNAQTPNQRILQRFMSKVAKRKSGCWEWVAGKNSRGYGQFWVSGKATLAHRGSYQFFIGRVPDGLFICHRCDNPLCVNPDHLFQGTAMDNLNDCIHKGRRPKSGPTRGNCKLAHLTKQQAGAVKSAIKSRTGSLRELSEKLKISIHIIKEISRGRNY